MESKNDLSVLKRQGETSIDNVPIFDQHIDYLKSLPTSYWILPLGVITVAIKYREPLIEFLELVKGLISNIAQSVLGKISFEYHILRESNFRYFCRK